MEARNARNNWTILVISQYSTYFYITIDYYYLLWEDVLRPCKSIVGILFWDYGSLCSTVSLKKAIVLPGLVDLMSVTPRRCLPTDTLL